MRIVRVVDSCALQCFFRGFLIKCHPTVTLLLLQKCEYNSWSKSSFNTSLWTAWYRLHKFGLTQGVHRQSVNARQEVLFFLSMCVQPFVQPKVVWSRACDSQEYCKGIEQTHFWQRLVSIGALRGEILYWPTSLHFYLLRFFCWSRIYSSAVTLLTSQSLKWIVKQCRKV